MNSPQQTTRAPITLDPSFNGTGIWRPEDLQPLPYLILGVAVQSASKGGYVYFTGEARSGLKGLVYALGRLKPDGTLDREFAKATNGLAYDNFAPNSGSLGHSIKLLDDGKILLVGAASGGSVPALGRFHADGTLDTTFGPDRNGHVVLRRPGAPRESSAIELAQEQEFTTCVEPLANGKILIVSTYMVTHVEDTQAFIFLLNSDGTLDTAFNKTGYLQVIEPGNSPDSVKLRSGLIDEKGNIVVCAKLKTNGASTALFVARYTAQGVPDTSFNGTGVRVFNSSDLVGATFFSLVKQTNNRLLGVGYTADRRGLLISLEPDGTDNIQFNSGKPLLIRLENNRTQFITAMMQPDGKILLMGSVTSSEPPPSPRQTYAAVARLLSDGKEDTDFNNNSFFFKAPISVYRRSLALQEDGKIIIGGIDYKTQPEQVMVMRFHSGIGGDSGGKG